MKKPKTMKKYLIAIIASMVVAPYAIAQKSKAAGASYPISPVPFTSVKITPGTFWGHRLEASRTTTIPLAWGHSSIRNQSLSWAMP